MSTIAAGTTSGTALVSTGDTTGTLVLQTNGTTTAVTIATNQVVTLAQPLPVGSGGTGATSLSGITTGTATNLAGGSNGTIPYQSAAGTTQMLAVGSPNQLLQTNGAGAPSWVTVSAGFTLGTPVATTSGTSITFTSIPAGTKQIILSLDRVSTNGTSRKLIQIGDSGGIETNDYFSQSTSFLGTTVNTSAGITGYCINSIVAAQQLSGSVSFTLLSSSTNTWAASGVLTNTVDSNDSFITSGAKALSGVLDRIQITTANGTDAFDNGTINIAYI